MGKRINLILTITGILLIITLTTIFTMQDNKEKELTSFIEYNLLDILDTCISDNNCNKESISIKELYDLNYISDNLYNKIKPYYANSYIDINNKKVYLINN